MKREAAIRIMHTKKHPDTRVPLDARCSKTIKDLHSNKVFYTILRDKVGLNLERGELAPALAMGGCVMLFDGGAVVPADVFLDAFSAPRAVLTSLALEDLVERRVALAIKAHRFRSLHTCDMKDVAIHCEPGKQRSYDKRLTDLDAAIAEHGRNRRKRQRAG